MKARLIYIAVVAAVLAAYLAELYDPFGVADGHM
jgi:ABC-type thiamin/hydroxymethylpyrimidine transport system permease subunit